jgi:hypothetical protein
MLELTAAIGTHTPATSGIGHRGPMTPQRWTQLWAYYPSPQDYLFPLGRGPAGDSCLPLLDLVDPDRSVRAKVRGYRDELSGLTELLAQRPLYALDWILSGYGWDPTRHEAANAAIGVIEDRLRTLGADAAILDHLGGAAVDGRLQPCSHKLFRRLDIILSSIGANRWRAGIPSRGTDGLALARELDTYLDPVLAWARRAEAGVRQHRELHPGSVILRNLGEGDPAKRFLARLLHSLLLCQQTAVADRGQGLLGSEGQ